DRRFAYGPSAAVFFTVPEADQQPGTKDDPASQAPAGTSSPDATSPNATIPDATTPNATAPDATSPDATSPESTRQGEATPGATVPGGTAPGSDLSGYSIPGGGGPAASGPGSGSSGATTSPATGSGDGPTDGGPTGGTGSSEPVVSPRPGNPPVTHDGITIISVTPVDSVGHTVIIIGDNLPQNATVSIDGLPTYVIAQRISTITVTIPNGITSTAPDVTIADRTGGNVTMPDAFTYHPPSPQPEATAPASPAPGTDAPGGDQGTVPTSPANNDTAGQTTLTGPTGTVYRPGPTLGAGTVRAGVTLAPITANNPLAGIAVSSWGRHRCVHVVCHAIAL
ncbi:MAG: hypothetical protein JXA67_07755, partial [Micromonosporaceae bacterium]|nr:hypothetical protein [Micromonosporaceae bacterium]